MAVIMDRGGDVLQITGADLSSRPCHFAQGQMRIIHTGFIGWWMSTDRLSTGCSGTKHHTRPHCTRKQLHCHETYHHIHLLYPETKHLYLKAKFHVYLKFTQKPSITYMNIVLRNKTVWLSHPPWLGAFGYVESSLRIGKFGCSNSSHDRPKSFKLE